MRFLLVLLVVSACYSPGYRDCEITCASGTCPSGLTCSAGVCRAPGMTGACNVQPGDDANLGDTPLDVADAAQLGPWMAPMLVQLQGGGQGDRQPTLSSDMLELYLVRDNMIYRAMRSSVGATWSPPEPDFSLSQSSIADDSPALTANGLAIYFASRRAPSQDFDLWFATRNVPQGPWQAPRHIQELAQPPPDRGVAVTNDDLTLVFHTGNLTAQTRVMMSERIQGMPWPPPIELPALAQGPGVSPQDPMLSADKLTIYFHARDPLGNIELYEASRPSLSQPFGTPTPITELNSTRIDESPWISPDGRRMFFASDRNGTMEIWESRR